MTSSSSFLLAFVVGMSTLLASAEEQRIEVSPNDAVVIQAFQHALNELNLDSDPQYTLITIDSAEMQEVPGGTNFYLKSTLEKESKKEGFRFTVLRTDDLEFKVLAREGDLMEISADSAEAIAVATEAMQSITGEGSEATLAVLSSASRQVVADGINYIVRYTIKSSTGYSQHLSTVFTNATVGSAELIEDKTVASGLVRRDAEDSGLQQALAYAAASVVRADDRFGDQAGELVEGYEVVPAEPVPEIKRYKVTFTLRDAATKETHTSVVVFDLTGEEVEAMIESHVLVKVSEAGEEPNVVTTDIDKNDPRALAAADFAATTFSEKLMLVSKAAMQELADGSTIYHLVMVSTNARDVSTQRSLQISHKGDIYTIVKVESAEQLGVDEPEEKQDGNQLHSNITMISVGIGCVSAAVLFGAVTFIINKLKISVDTQTSYQQYRGGQRM